jgi:GDP-L-fucose synthase
MAENGPIFVAGHTGLVGSALVRALQARGESLLLATRSELDLRRQSEVEAFFAQHRPRQVYLAAARVGGIGDNAAHPADFIRDNLLIQSNVIDSAYRFGAQKLLFLGSSCIYPRDAPQPLKPEYLMSGPLEPTNSAYAMAKLAGIEMCRSYRRQHGFNAIAAMPTNLYGPGDRFDERQSHVIPALILRFIRARDAGEKVVTVWGSGKALREFLYVDDLAEALLLLMDRYEDDEIVNIGSGEEVSIEALARLIAEAVGYSGELQFDTNYPDGTPRKMLDSSAIRFMGWRPKVTLFEGISRVVGCHVR